MHSHSYRVQCLSSIARRLTVHVRTGKVVQEFTCPNSIILAHQELGWTHRQAETRDSPQAKQILETVARSK